MAELDKAPSCQTATYGCVLPTYCCALVEVSAILVWNARRTVGVRPRIRGTAEAASVCLVRRQYSAGALPKSVPLFMRIKVALFESSPHYASNSVRELETTRM